MKNSMNRIKSLIGIHLPYKKYIFIVRILTILSILLFIVMIALVMYNPKPVDIIDSKVNQIVELSVSEVSEGVDDYHIVYDGKEYYIYYQYGGLNESLVRLQLKNTTQATITGVKSVLKEGVYESLYDSYYKMTQKSKTDFQNEVNPNTYIEFDGVPYAGEIGFTFIMIAFLLILFIGTKIIMRRVSHHFDEMFQVLYYREQEELLMGEIIEPKMTFYDINVLVLDHFIIANQPSPFVIGIEDIIMIYKQVTLSKIMLYVVDRDYHTHLFMTIKKKDERIRQCDQVLDLIENQYPKILVGNSEENRNILKQMKGLSLFEGH